MNSNKNLKNTNPPQNPEKKLNKKKHFLNHSIWGQDNPDTTAGQRHHKKRPLALRNPHQNTTKPNPEAQLNDYYDQVEFISEMQRCLNGWNQLMEHNHIKRIRGKTCLNWYIKKYTLSWQKRSTN